jgi:hypothetical protein
MGVSKRRVLRDFEDIPHFIDRHVHLVRDLFRRRVVAQLLKELPGPG